MRLIIIRHGESVWNREGRYQGQMDAPLSELGLRQAEALAERLRNEPLDAIFTSPLQRAARTAEAIARYHPHVPMHTALALLEIHHGEWQGLLVEEVIERYGDGLREWRQHPTRAQMPGGEALPGSDIPSASPTLAIVFAVKKPPQEPMPGQATHSSSCRSSSLIRPASYCPTAS